MASAKEIRQQRDEFEKRYQSFIANAKSVNGKEDLASMIKGFELALEVAKVLTLSEIAEQLATQNELSVI